VPHQVILSLNIIRRGEHSCESLRFCRADRAQFDPKVAFKPLGIF